MKQINISFVVTEKDRKALKEVAEQMGYNSVSSLVREAVLYFLQDHSVVFEWRIVPGKHKDRNYLDA